MSTKEMLLMIFAVALGTFVTRVLPFVFFRKSVPASVKKLGDLIPFSMMAFLVVYTLRDTALTSAPYGANELLALLSIVLVRRWKKNLLLSVLTGTFVYMLLVQTGALVHF